MSRPAPRLRPLQPRSGPSPARGTGRRGLPRTAIFALLLAATGSLVPAPARGQGDPCAAPRPERIKYALGLDTVRDDHGTTVSASFRLIEASGPRGVAMLIFADGIQRHGPAPLRPIACGQRATWTTRVPAAAGAPLDVHVTAHPSPGIPAALRAAGPDGLPSPATLTAYAYDAEDVATVAFGPTRAPPPGLTRNAATRTSSGRPDAYLYARGRPATPTSVQVLAPGVRRWRFGVWFGETAQRGGDFAITCLLDDRQFDAFAGRPLWYGPVDRGEAVLIPARTPTLVPGWHQVRCLVLDGLFSGAERRPAWPYVIRSTFVYRRP